MTSGGAYREAYSNIEFERFRSGDLTHDLATDNVGVLSDTLETRRQRFISEFSLKEILLDSRGWLGRQLSLLTIIPRSGLWPVIIGAIKYEPNRAWALTNPTQGVVFENDGVRTILKTAYRLQGLDLENPRIKEGLAVTKKVLSSMQLEMQNRGINFLVILIPTKESVYGDIIEEMDGALLPTHQQLVHMETNIRIDLKRFMIKNDIAYLDVLPTLQDATFRHEFIYTLSDDGHPLPNGYRLIAQAVQETISGDL